MFVLSCHHRRFNRWEHEIVTDRHHQRRAHGGVLYVSEGRGLTFRLELASVGPALMIFWWGDWRRVVLRGTWWSWGTMSSGCWMGLALKPLWSLVSPEGTFKGVVCDVLFWCHIGSLKGDIWGFYGEDVVKIVPITSRPQNKKEQKYCVKIESLFEKNRTSWVLCNHITTVSKKRLSLHLRDINKYKEYKNKNPQKKLYWNQFITKVPDPEFQEIVKKVWDNLPRQRDYTNSTSK